MSAQIHQTAQVSEEAKIGDGTQIGANSSIDKDVIIGANCKIGQNVSIGINVVLLDEVIVDDGSTILGPALIEKGAHLFQGTRVGDVPQNGPVSQKVTIIREGSQVWSNAIINRGVSVGPRALVQHSARVVENVKTGNVVSGDPARVIFILNVEGAQFGIEPLFQNIKEMFSRRG